MTALPGDRDVQIERHTLSEVAWQHAGHDLRLQPDLSLVCTRDGGTLIGDLAGLRVEAESVGGLDRWIESLHEDANGLVWITKSEIRAALALGSDK